MEPGLLPNRTYPRLETERKLPVQVLVGPDLDGDGRREVFAACVVRYEDSPSSAANLILVEALSGTDGHALWRWVRRERPHDSAAVGPLRWWQPGPDGWPELAVPYGAVHDRREATAVPRRVYALTAGTGRLVHSIAEFGLPHVADLDGDGIPDLYAYRPRKDGDTVVSPGGGALHAVRGAPAEAWRRLAQCQPACDLDGDGMADAFPFDKGRGGQVAAVSGRTGRFLWRRRTM